MSVIQVEFVFVSTENGDHAYSILTHDDQSKSVTTKEKGTKLAEDDDSIVVIISEEEMSDE